MWNYYLGEGSGGPGRGESWHDTVSTAWGPHTADVAEIFCLRTGLACAGGPGPLTGSHCCPGPHPLRPQFLQGMAPVGPVFLESRSAFPRRSQGQGSVTSATGGEALSLNPASPYLRHKPDPEKASKRWSVSVAKCVQTRENVTEGETGVGLVT